MGRGWLTTAGVKARTGWAADGQFDVVALLEVASIVMRRQFRGLRWTLSKLASIKQTDLLINARLLVINFTEHCMSIGTNSANSWHS